MNKKITLIILGTMLGVLIPIEIFGISLLYKHGCFTRLIPINNLDSIQTTFYSDGLAELADKFHNKDPLVLLRQVMNTVGKAEPRKYRNALDIYRNALKGKGTLCDGMAELYFSVLRLNGIKARLVYLKKYLYDIYDTHSTVEVFMNGKWVIFDPTFHVSFKKGGQLLSAQEIQESLFTGSFYDIKPVFYGAVKYPARIDTYYINWLPLFNNVFVIGNTQRAWWQDIPPVNYWTNLCYYRKMRGYSDYNLQFHNQLFFLFIVLIPVVIYISAALIAVIVIVIWKTNRFQIQRLK